MKNLLYIFTLLVFALTSCEGPPGIDGQDGINILGQTFEKENINFSYNAQNNLWSTIVDVPSNIEVFESDAILVYRFDGQVGLNDGSNADLWSLIPQNFFTDDGTIQFVASHTFIDIELYIDGNYNLSNLETGFTSNQIFRFVVVPSDFGHTVDVTNFAEVMNAIDN